MIVVPPLVIVFAYAVSSTLSWCWHVLMHGQFHQRIGTCLSNHPSLSSSPLHCFRVKDPVLKPVCFNYDDDCKCHKFGGSSLKRFRGIWLFAKHIIIFTLSYHSFIKASWWRGKSQQIQSLINFF